MATTETGLQVERGRPTTPLTPSPDSLTGELDPRPLDKARDWFMWGDLNNAEFPPAGVPTVDVHTEGFSEDGITRDEEIPRARITHKLTPIPDALQQLTASEAPLSDLALSILKNIQHLNETALGIVIQTRGRITYNENATTEVAEIAKKLNIREIPGTTLEQAVNHWLTYLEADAQPEKGSMNIVRFLLANAEDLGKDLNAEPLTQKDLITNAINLKDTLSPLFERAKALIDTSHPESGLPQQLRDLLVNTRDQFVEGKRIYSSKLSLAELLDYAEKDIQLKNASVFAILEAYLYGPREDANGTPITYESWKNLWQQQTVREIREVAIWQPYPSPLEQYAATLAQRQPVVQALPEIVEAEVAEAEIFGPDGLLSTAILNNTQQAWLDEYRTLGPVEWNEQYTATLHARRVLAKFNS